MLLTVLDVLQHLQTIDKRTCWHGHAGGRLSADPKNVVSIVQVLMFVHIYPLKPPLISVISSTKCVL